MKIQFLKLIFRLVFIRYIFYCRSHLRDIRDRSVLRLFESDGAVAMPGSFGVPSGSMLPHWEDQSYFSEPEFDSEFQHQHIHKSKVSERTVS